ncbi:hypothetical protein ACWX0P_24165 [Vibrio mediterranei]
MKKYIFTLLSFMLFGCSTTPPASTVEYQKHSFVYDTTLTSFHWQGGYSTSVNNKHKIELVRGLVYEGSHANLTFEFDTTPFRVKNLELSDEGNKSVIVMPRVGASSTKSGKVRNTFKLSCADLDALPTLDTAYLSVIEGKSKKQHKLQGSPLADFLKEIHNYCHMSNNGQTAYAQR